MSKTEWKLLLACLAVWSLLITAFVATAPAKAAGAEPICVPVAEGFKQLEATKEVPVFTGSAAGGEGVLLVTVNPKTGEWTVATMYQGGMCFWFAGEKSKVTPLVKGDPA